MGKKKKNKKAEPWRPQILILEGLGGADDCVHGAGGKARVASPTYISSAFDAIEHEHWDGLLLTGGGDVDPREYGEKPHKHVYGVNEDRDLIELYALEIASERGLPVLGICRGAQIMAVGSGGALEQHIDGHRSGSHPVGAIKGSTLESAVDGEKMLVVSLHHQEVKAVGDGWSKSGIALDGTCEAVESDDGRCLGVQFHPEMDSNEPYAQNLFRWLVEEASKRAGQKTPGERWDDVRNMYSYSYSNDALWDRSWRTHVNDKDDAEWFVPTAAGRTALYAVRKVKELKRGSGRTTFPVRTTWLCPADDCRIIFDKVEDRDDHAAAFHGIRTSTMMHRASETASS